VPDASPPHLPPAQNQSFPQDQAAAQNPFPGQYQPPMHDQSPGQNQPPVLDQSQSPGQWPSTTQYPPPDQYPFAVQGSGSWVPTHPPARNLPRPLPKALIVSCGVLAVIMMAATMVMVMRHGSSGPQTQSTKVKHGQVWIMDPPDEITLALPQGWEQIPTKAELFHQWVLDASQRSSSARGIPDLDDTTLQHFFVIGAHLDDSRSGPAFLFGVRLPASDPLADPQATPELAAQSLTDRGYANVQAGATTIAGKPALKATGYKEAGNGTGAPQGVYATYYILVNAHATGGYLIYFLDSQPGDLQRWQHTVIDSIKLS